MSERLRYKLSDAKRQKQLESYYLNTSDPNDLDSEIASLRLLIHEALESGDAPLSNSLTNTLGKLVQISEVSKVRRGELLQKQIVLQLALQAARIQSEVVANKYAGWELDMDVVRQKFLTLVSEAQNPDPTEK
jgi:hypothetical protein